MGAHERLNAAPCGFLSFTDHGTITWFNRTLLDMLGYAEADLEGRHVEHILSVGSRIFYQTHWFPLLRLHGRAEEIFLMLRSSDGEDIGVLVNAVRRKDDEGVRYDCVLMRVRERQKYEAELLRAKRAAEESNAELEVQRREAERLRAAAEEANRAKSTFLTVMSHELRTPLNAISGYVEILEMGIHGPVNDAQRESLGRIGRSGEHLLRLINEILDLARIEAGHVEYVMEDVPVDKAVGAVTPLVEPQLHGKGQTLRVDLQPDLAVRADREKIQQILLNVVGNAVKFTPNGGHIGIDAQRAGDLIRIRVSDTGIGIPADKLDAVFDPFVRVGDGPTEEGTGLGLAISRDMARGMGGDLTAQSTPGRGSTFTLALPRAGGAPAVPDAAGGVPAADAGDSSP